MFSSRFHVYIKVLLGLNNLRQVTMTTNLNIQKFREELRRIAKAREVRLLGILNCTPDSFYDGGKNIDSDKAITTGLQMLDEGAFILDVGGQSSRPGAINISEEEEWSRVQPVIEGILTSNPSAFISIDTYRSYVAKRAVKLGAVLVNDISAGTLDTELIPTVANLNVPYVLMHMQGSPQTMQKSPEYVDVVEDVSSFFKDQITRLRSHGIEDIILDPGFGFGKTLQDNYRLLNNLDSFNSFGLPILAGISRKSMVSKVINCEPTESLNGTSALNTIALQNGALFLRVHDIKEALEVSLLHNHLCKS